MMFKLKIFKGAVLLIWINLLRELCHRFQPSSVSLPALDYVSVSFLITTPLFGWIADSWIGRYKVILYSIITQTIWCVILNISLVIPYSHISIKLQYLCFILNTVIYAAFQASLLPFVIDQMIGGLADELSAAVNWWFWSTSTPYVVKKLGLPASFLEKAYVVPAEALIFSMCIALCLAFLLLFKHWLVKEQKMANPIKQIVRVLNYAQNNKYPANRSALTYWEKEIPSRFNLGKEKYGGPFSEEEVENVKTFLRLLPLILVITLPALCEVGIPGRIMYNHMLVVKPKQRFLSYLMHQLNYVRFYTSLMACFGIPALHLLMPLYHKQLSRFTILKQIICGLFLTCTGSLGFIVIEVVGHHITPNATCMFQESSPAVPINIDSIWNTIPAFLYSLGMLMYGFGILKFIIAQSPHQMRGLLFGSFFGLSAAFWLPARNMYKIFRILSDTPPSCGFYFYLTNSFIKNLAFALFIILSRFYKLRQRNDPVNVHLIVGEHVERYITQREQFENSSSSQSYGTMEDITHHPEVVIS